MIAASIQKKHGIASFKGTNWKFRVYLAELTAAWLREQMMLWNQQRLELQEQQQVQEQENQRLREQEEAQARKTKELQNLIQAITDAVESGKMVSLGDYKMGRQVKKQAGKQKLSKAPNRKAVLQDG